MSEVEVEIIKTEETKESEIKYLNINVSNSEVERDPDIVRLRADVGILEYVKLKKGKWINGNPICPCCGEDKFKDLDADIWSDWRPKHCPNCGAKMEAEE